MHQVAIIGAGISGICAGIQLRQAGTEKLIILEKAGSVGGTWRDNTYPGAACDIPAHLYSFSFAPNGDWVNKYATQPEILTYLESCVQKFKLEECIEFDAEVVSAKYNTNTKRWLIWLADGRSIDAAILITACGQLNRPFIPELPGKDTFPGPRFHSAQWRHDCDIRKRSVAIIGSAASAVQIVGALVWSVRRLIVFQRTPNWIAPSWNRPYSRGMRTILAHVPVFRRLYRMVQFARHEIYMPAFRMDSLASRALTAITAVKMRRKIIDDRLRKVLIPDYPFGCKRVLKAPGYLRFFQLETVSLVSEQIERIAPTGIITKDGRLHEADVIVYATGFKALEFLAPIAISGRNGISLAESWSHGSEAYLGMAVPEFPNLFILYGPNTNLGHNSVIFMIECQVSYIKNILQHMRRAGAAEVSVRAEALERFKGKLDRRMNKTTWAANCQSFYKMASGRVIGIWPYSTVRYWWATRKPRLEDYTFRP